MKVMFVMQKLSPYLHDEDGAKYVDIPGLRKVFVQRGNGETALFIMYSMVRASSILKKVETSINEISMEGISESEK